MARQAVDEDPTGQAKAVGVKDIDMVQPVGRSHEPFAIGTEAEMVGIDDVLDDPSTLAGLDVETQQFVGDRRADQHFLAVGRND